MNLRPSVPLLVLAFAALAVSGRAAAPLDTSAWEWRQPVEIDAAGPVRIALPAAIRELTRLDAGDLRVLGPDGAEVACVRLQPADTPPRRPLALPLHPRLAGRTTVLEFALPAPDDVEMIMLDSPADDFLKSVTIEAAGADGVWRVVARDLVLFRLPSGPGNMAAEIGGPLVQHFRLTIDDRRSEPIPFTRVFLHLRARPGWEPDTLVAPVRSVETAAGATRIIADLGVRHRQLVGISVTARDAVFHRAVRALTTRLADDAIVEETLATGTIQRVALPEHLSFSATTFPVKFTAPSAELVLEVEDGDNPPLSIESVTVRLAPETLAFTAVAPGTYTLIAGQPAATTPRYDVAAFERDWLALPLTPARAGALARNPGYRAPALSRDVPELAGAFDGKGWTLARTVRIASPGAQALELDLAVLAASHSDLGDLRLVRDGRQVPYLVERTGRQRSVPLALTPAADPKRPQTGRWKIALPAARAPLTFLIFEIAEPLFERRVRLYETVRDRNRGTYEITLGAAIWTRRSADGPSRFRVEFSGVPQGRELILEIEHGDNAPFAPVKLEATYPLRRLRFRAEAATELALHFGNERATAPRYDLQLAAPRLLAAPEVKAELAAQLEAPAESPGLALFGDRSSPGTRAIFWGSLGLVVVVLLWFVAKLLPKPPAGGA